MRASKVSYETLKAAADEIGVSFECEPRGRGFRVRLFPGPRTILYSEGPRGGRRKYRAKYHRRTASAFGSSERPVYAVCWHGFRDFFRAVYRREPGAVFRTALATYQGRDDFERTYPHTAGRNIGSQAFPVCVSEACFCADTFDDVGPLYPYSEARA